MPATAFKNLAIADIDGLLAFLDTTLLAAGWTSLAVMNATTGQPATSRIRQERIYQINGTTLAPAKTFVGIARMDVTAASAPHAVGFYAFTGCKGPIVLSSLSYPGSNQAVVATTATPHGFATGDLVAINGSSNEAFHSGFRGNVFTPNTITVTGPTTFTYTDDTFFNGPTASATGGFALAIYNIVSTRGTQQTAPQLQWDGDDNTMQVIGEVDEFRCVFVIKQGGETRFTMLGQSGRRHIPAAFSDTAFLTAPVTGPGTVTLTLDRNCPNLCSSQSAWLVAKDSGLVERAAITVLGPTSVQMTLVGTGTYPAGSIFGDDPAPVCVVGQGPGSFTTAPLALYSAYFPHFTDGTRTDGVSAIGHTQSYTIGVNSLLDPEDAANDATGYDQGQPIVFYRGSVSTPVGVRANMAGTSVDLAVAFGVTSQNDDDFEQTGCDTPQSNYAIFPSQSVNNGGQEWALALGPGQS